MNGMLTIEGTGQRWAVIDNSWIYPNVQGIYSSLLEAQKTLLSTSALLALQNGTPIEELLPVQGQI